MVTAVSHASAMPIRTELDSIDGLLEKPWRFILRIVQELLTIS